MLNNLAPPEPVAHCHICDKPGFSAIVAKDKQCLQFCYPQENELSPFPTAGALCEDHHHTLQTFKDNAQRHQGSNSWIATCSDGTESALKDVRVPSFGDVASSSPTNGVPSFPADVSTPLDGVPRFQDLPVPSNGVPSFHDLHLASTASTGVPRFEDLSPGGLAHDDQGHQPTESQAENTQEEEDWASHFRALAKDVSDMPEWQDVVLPPPPAVSMPLPEDSPIATSQEDATISFKCPTNVNSTCDPLEDQSRHWPPALPPSLATALLSKPVPPTIASICAPLSPPRSPRVMSLLDYPPHWPLGAFAVRNTASVESIDDKSSDHPEEHAAWRDSWNDPWGDWDSCGSGALGVPKKPLLNLLQKLDAPMGRSEDRRKTMRLRPDTRWDQLHVDVRVAINQYLDVYTLLRGCAVSKSWNEYTCDPLACIAITPPCCCVPAPTPSSFLATLPRRYPQLERLSICPSRSFSFPNMMSPALPRSFWCRTLSRLELPSCSLLRDEWVVHIVDRLPALRYLNLQNSAYLSDAAMLALAGRGVGGSGAPLWLCHLDVSNCRLLTDACCVALASLTTLRTLDVSGCQRLTCQGIVNLTRRRPVQLPEPMAQQDNNDVVGDRGQGVETCSQRNCTEVRVGEEGLVNLESLRLRGCWRVANEGVAALQCCPRLACLHLEGSGRVETQSLLTGLHFAALRQLDLDYCMLITDQLLRALSVCSLLTHLSLANCVRVSDLGVAFLCGRHHTQLEHAHSPTEPHEATQTGTKRNQPQTHPTRQTHEEAGRSCVGEREQGASVPPITLQPRLQGNGCLRLRELSLRRCPRLSRQSIAHVATLPCLVSLNLSLNRQLERMSIVPLLSLHSLQRVTLAPCMSVRDPPIQSLVERGVHVISSPMFSS